MSSGQAGRGATSPVQVSLCALWSCYLHCLQSPALQLREKPARIQQTTEALCCRLCCMIGMRHWVSCSAAHMQPCTSSCCLFTLSLPSLIVLIVCGRQ